MLEDLLHQGILRESDTGDLELCTSPQTTTKVAGYFDFLDKHKDEWSARGWAVDSKTKQPCVFVIPYPSREGCA